MISIVANGHGCLMDKPKKFSTFWYKISKKSTRKLPNIFGDFLICTFYLQKMQEKMPKY